MPGTPGRTRGPLAALPQRQARPPPVLVSAHDDHVRTGQTVLAHRVPYTTEPSSSTKRASRQALAAVRPPPLAQRFVENYLVLH